MNCKEVAQGYLVLHDKDASSGVRTFALASTLVFILKRDQLRLEVPI